MFCGKCGSEIPEGNKFCGNCGAAIEDTTVAKDDENIVSDKAVTESVESKKVIESSNKGKPSKKKYIIIAIAVIALVAIIYALNHGGNSNKDDVQKGNVVTRNTSSITPTFDAVGTASKLTYYWSLGGRAFDEVKVAIVFQNPTEYNLNVSANAVFKDDAGNIIDAKTYDIENFEAGQEWAEVSYISSAPANVEITFTVKEETYYKPIRGFLQTSESISGDNVIITATNNGTESIEFLEYVVLCYRGDELVEDDWGYITDNDSELKSGASLTESCEMYESFDSARVFYIGYAR